MTFWAKVGFLQWGEIRKWQIWIIHVGVPFYLGLLLTGSVDIALGSLCLSILIWQMRIWYAASQDWKDIQAKMKRLLEEVDDPDDIPF